jgi:hypothetical protein
MRQMNAWVGVLTSFCMILGCFGMIIVLFFWDEVFEYCCTPYVQLLVEEEEEEKLEEVGGQEVNHIELQVVSSEKEELGGQEVEPEAELQVISSEK